MYRSSHSDENLEEGWRKMKNAAVSGCARKASPDSASGRVFAGVLRGVRDVQEREDEPVRRGAQVDGEWHHARGRRRALPPQGVRQEDLPLCEAAPAIPCLRQARQ